MVTIGSDAHKPAYLGYGFEEACDILKSCGFTHYVYFVKHQPKFVLIR